LVCGRVVGVPPRSAATRFAGAVAGRRPVDPGLTGSCRRLVRLALRLWLRWWSRCRRLLKLRLLNWAIAGELNWAIRGERIVVNGKECVAIEIRLIVHRHQSVTRHDESPTLLRDTFRWTRDVTAPSRRGLGWV
jgi:hypothetical protein